MLAMNWSKVARWLGAAALAAGAVGWQASEANAAKRLYVTVSKSNPNCTGNGAGTPYFGYALGAAGALNFVCNIAATGGTAFTDSNGCASASAHQPFVVTQTNGVGNAVAVPGCTGAVQFSWTTAQTLNCSTPSTANCVGGSNWQVISQGKN
jgi:hypothetical protein